MVLCEHCIDYLKSQGVKMMVSSEPLYERGDDDELDEVLACEWCDDTLDWCGELYKVEGMR